MKISELIAVLQIRLERWGDCNVECTWEGIFEEIEENSIYKIKNDASVFHHHETPTIVIDANENYYKATFAEDPFEGE